MFSGMGEAPKVPGLERENNADQVMAENESGTTSNAVEMPVALDKKRTMNEESIKHVENVKE